MANRIDFTNRKEEYYEDFRARGLFDRYKFSEKFQIDTGIVQGEFSVDDTLEYRFQLYPTGGILINQIESATEEQEDIKELAIRHLQSKYASDCCNARLLELQQKFGDGRVTCFVNEFIDIDYFFEKEVKIDEHSSWLETRVFYMHDNGAEEDITHLFVNTGHIINSTFSTFRELLQANTFYMMCRIAIVTEDGRFKTEDDEELEYYKEVLKNEYRRFRFEVDVHKLILDK